MPQVTLQQALDQAIQLYHAGRLGDAASIYRQVLTHQPDHAPTLHMLGIVCAQTGNWVEAEQYLRDAIRANPNEPSYHANFANVLQEQGRLDEAITSYREALSRGASSTHVQNNLANTLQKMGRTDEAIAAYRTAINLQPDFPEAHFNLANALRNKDELDAAIREYQRAIELRPDYGQAHLNLGIALLAQGVPRDAVAAFRRALQLLPDSFDAQRSLGLALQRTGQFDEAIDLFRALVNRQPNSPEAQHDLGNASREAGRLDEAIAAYRRAIALRPDFADSHYGLAWTLLIKGESDSGFAEYEWRTRLKEMAAHARHFSRPQWDGSHVPAQRILLYAEQGFGDTLFAWRYVRVVAERCKEVIVQCPRPLHRLLAAQSVAAQVIADDEDLPDFDLYCPLMSLPHVLGTTQSQAAEVPYVTADATLVGECAAKIAAQEKIRNTNLEIRNKSEIQRTNEQNTGLENSNFPAFGFVSNFDTRISDLPPRPRRVGLVWAGNPVPPDRSVPLSMLGPLAQVSSVRYHSIQTGIAARQTPPRGLELVDWSEDLTDFAATAALIANLDLVITIDTAVAHLAGAMGKPVWVMLQFAPDWRWSLGREASSWYPTMKLFRQTTPGDWPGVIARVTAELNCSTPPA